MIMFRSMQNRLAETVDVGRWSKSAEWKGVKKLVKRYKNFPSVFPYEGFVFSPLYMKNQRSGF